MSLTQDEKEFIRLIAREAANEAVKAALENGWMSTVRETARAEAQEIMKAHANTCPVAGNLFTTVGKYAVGFLVALGAMAAIVWGWTERTGK
jgi:hypothetical protein